MNLPSDKVNAAAVRVDGAAIEGIEGILAILHKPSGFVCSHDSREGETIYDLLPANWGRRRPAVTSVGRLDRDTTGALLVTDVPGLVQRWTSPRSKVLKVYEVRVDRDLDPVLPALFSSGRVRIGNEARLCQPSRLELGGPCTARLELTEGMYHQVKRMFGSQGYRVLRLHRSRFGEFELGDLPVGEWRLLPIPGRHRP